MDNQERTILIKKEMVSCKHTQHTLASKLNIHRVSLENKFSGKSPWKVEELYTLAKIYNKPPIYFF